LNGPFLKKIYRAVPKKKKGLTSAPEDFGHKKTGFKQLFETPFFRTDIIIFLPYR